MLLSAPFRPVDSGPILCYTHPLLIEYQSKLDPSTGDIRHMEGIRRFFSKFAIFGELWVFMRVRKKWWLGPILFFLLALSILIVFTEGSALAPFIYALF